MCHISRLTTRALCALILLMTTSASADAQRRGVPRHPPHPQPSVTLRGHVFIGGYFYDPFFGPYPWWHRAAYPFCEGETNTLELTMKVGAR